MSHIRAYRIASCLAYAALACFVGAALVMRFTGSAAAALLMLCLTIALVCAASALRSRHYRCPHCSGALSSMRGPLPRHCPHCGKPLK